MGILTPNTLIRTVILERVLQFERRIKLFSLMSKTVGAPSQHSQPSRKGKKAWRKNVDIEEIEIGLESLRDEERLTGSAYSNTASCLLIDPSTSAQLHRKTNQELFQVDIKGDDQRMSF